jgi:electron transfer flavoprotein beta subunit
VERDVPGGVEVLEVNLPFALSAAKGMAEQRIPNMRGIMAARTKPLTVVPAATRITWPQRSSSNCHRRKAP